ncbi:MAG TPA: hypothetical protein VES42_18670 [Pilimelia sp.]|nr:hypothetical protein [Pilimelia sp.]
MPAATQGGQPAYGPPPAYGQPSLPRDAVRVPARVEPVPGTEFGLGYLSVPPVTSGVAVGALVAGIASIVVSLLVACLGLTGVQDGWGGSVSGAFAVLSVLLGAAAVGVGLAARRQIRRATPPGGTPRFTGGGLAVAGIACGAAGLVLTVLAFGLVLVLVLG